MKRDGRVVIAGGGVVAASAIDALRQEGHSGPITVLTDERCGPYARPPLSKAVLSGSQPVASTTLNFDGADVEMLTASRATRLDLAQRKVVLADGANVPFDGLIIATGASARRLPEHESALALRTVDDLEIMQQRMAVAHDVLVVGSGFLALEIVSAACAAGRHVFLGLRPTALRRRVGAQLARLLVDSAIRAGVTLVDESEVLSLKTDLRIAAIGCEANVAWLGDQVPVADGVLTDAFGRVAEDVVAAGDVAAYPDSSGQPRRTPTWTSAIAQAQTAVRTLLGAAATPHVHDSYMWTEAFGLNLKFAGVWPPSGEPTTVSGDSASLSAVLAWPGSAVAINTRIPISRLKAIAAAAAQ